MTIDNTQPHGAWSFDKDVTDAFDDMLSRSIPQYEVMRSLCTKLAIKYAKPHTTILDIGCSRGEAMAQIIYHLGAYNRYIGLEISEPMLIAARSRYKTMIDCQLVEIRQHDLRDKNFPIHGASVILAVLTVQFTPIEYRLRILQQLFDALLPQGLLIMVEKVIGASAAIDEQMVEQYYDLKSQNGYSTDAIERKRLSLEGVLVPMTAEWNETMLKTTGFRQVDCFWRWMNFAGWMAIKT